MATTLSERGQRQLLSEPGALPIGNLKDSSYAVPADPWTAVWGQPRFPYQAKPYDRGDVTTLVLPEAFVGQRPMISQSIERQVYHDDNWHVRVVMPFGEIIEGMTYSWNETIFNKHVATPVPELGVVRLVESKRMEHEGSVVRYGVGYYMQHGFMNTREGMLYHMEHLRQLAQASLEAIKFDVVISLLQANNMHRQWEVEHNVYKGRSLEKALANRVWMFAAMQKHKRPINLIDTRISEIMNRYGGRADTWIMPPQLINYLTNVPDEYLSYKEAGPRGPDIVFDRAQPFSIINKNRVFISRTYETNDITGREELLSQRSEIGEYYTMFDRYKDDHEGYTSRCRNIQIYDQDRNSWHEITAMWALDNSLLFDENGDPLYSDKIRAYDSGFTGHDQHEDVFNYYDENQGKWVHATYFGELPTDYFTVDDKLEWARMAALKLRRFGIDFDDVTRGLDFLRQEDEDRFDLGQDANIGAGYNQLGSEARSAVSALAKAARQFTYNPDIGSDANFLRHYLLPDRVEIMERVSDSVDESAYDDSIVAGIEAILQGAEVNTASAQKLRESQIDSYKAMMIAAVGRLGRASAKKTVLQVARSITGNTKRAVEQDTIARVSENLDAFNVKNQKEAAQNLQQFSQHFDELWAKYERNASGDSSSWRNTGMLASPTWLATLANHLESGGSSRLMPTDPDRRDLVMRKERLLRDTAHHPLREVSADERRVAASRLHEIHPVFFAEIGHEEGGLHTTYAYGKACSDQLMRQIGQRQGGIGDRLAEETAFDETRLKHAVASLGDAVNEPIGAPIATQPVDEIRNTKTWTISTAGLRAGAENEAIFALANAFDRAKIHRNAFVRMIKYDLPLPLSFIVTRPHMAYNMLCAIKCLSGYEMGRTVTRPAEFEVQDDAATHAHLGTLTFYAKSQVTQPKHVFVAREIYANGTLGGGGVDPIDPAHYRAGSAMKNMSESGQSLIVIALPYNYDHKGIFSLTGSQVIGEYAEYDTGDYKRLAYPTQARYNAIWGWNQARRVDDYDSGPYDGLPDVRNNNVVCYQGHTFYYLPTEKQFRVVQVGTGHWGADGTYIGANQVRNGELQAMKKVHWETYIHA